MYDVKMRFGSIIGLIIDLSKEEKKWNDQISVLASTMYKSMTAKQIQQGLFDYFGVPDNEDINSQIKHMKLHFLKQYELFTKIFGSVLWSGHI